MLLFCRLLFLFQNNLFSKNSDSISASNNLNPDQARCVVGPDPAADDTGRQSVHLTKYSYYYHY